MKQEKTEKPWYKRWWIYLLLGLIIGGLIGSANNNEEYSYCVDSCVNDMDSCTWDYSVLNNAQTNWYILQDDYDDCFSDLESCISLCKR